MPRHRSNLDDLLPASSRHSRRFVVWLGVSTLGVLGLVAGFNLLVDPYGFYGSSYPLERTQVVRDLKIGLLRQATPSPEALILGSSRVRMIDPRSASERFGLSFFHAGGPVGGPAHWLSFARYAIEDLGHPIRLIILGVDPSSFIGDSNSQYHPVQHRELRRHLRWPWHSRIRSWIHLWSPDLTETSWELFTVRDDPARRQLREQRSRAWRADGFRPSNPPLDAMDIFEKNVEIHRLPAKIASEHQRDFRALAELAAERGITIVAFITPEAPTLRQALEATHYPENKARGAAILRAASDLGVIWCGIDSLRFVDRDFVDPHHLGPRAGERMVRALHACARARGGS